MALTAPMKTKRRGLAASLFLLLLPGSVALTQTQAPLPVPPDQTLTPNQLNDLVAPIALYPDPLLSQVLVAATYPLEVVQAYQWLQRNPGLTGPALTQAAQEQNWDPSVQALVVFPDVLKRLNDDITWTTNLGNAFLGQQQDVMDAVQRMRQTAQQAGKLQSTPQENVVTTAENGQPYVEIEPAQPDVIYVPVYDPAWIWGPALWYPYPRWYWPPRPAAGLYFGFGGPINVGLFFGAGWHGWRGWGWRPGWGTHTVIVNNTFIHEHAFNTANVGRAHGTADWVHDPAHRAGVPYANSKLRQQYGDTVRRNVAPRAIPEPARTPGVQPMERFGNRNIPQNPPPAQNRGIFGGIQNGAAARTHEEHGFSSLGPARSMPAPRPIAPIRSAPAPRAAPAPRGRGR
jgi:hypothetical protein